jgi:hypothetical protein
MLAGAVWSDHEELLVAIAAWATKERDPIPIGRPDWAIASCEASSPTTVRPNDIDIQHARLSDLER